MKLSPFKFAVLTTLLFCFSACQKEQSIQPDLSPVSVHQPENGTVHTSPQKPTSREKQSADFFNTQVNHLATGKNCDDVIIEMANFLQPIADQKCETYFFCVLCMQDGAQVYVTGMVTPNGCPLKEAFELQAADFSLLGSLDGDAPSKSYQKLAEQFGSADNFPTISVAIQANACYNGGEALTVYNPDDWEAFSGDRYVVQWFHQWEPISSNLTTPCLSCGEYVVIVYDLLFQEIVGLAFYSVPCNSDDL